VTGEPMLDIRDVGKRFGATAALESATLQVQRGEFLTLLGPSGSGKTTLLRIVAGFEAPTGGEVFLRGRPISGLSPAARELGMVFQQYALFPHMNVADNVAYGLRLRGWDKARIAERVQEMLDAVRLPDLGDRYPRQLSGGQQQRVSFARALAYEPEMLLMDEPLGALDRALRIEMEQEIRRIHRDLGTTVVYVTHDRQEALALSDRIAIMRAGRIVAVGTPEELYYRPPDAFVASFFADANLLPAEVLARGDERATVRCLGGELECAVAGDPGDGALVSVRRRSLRVRDDGGFPVDGVVAETLLFGDERHVTLDVAGAGSVIAVTDARESAGLRVGEQARFFVAPGEAVLVAAA
jgi:putative spermidine/putrescine transport system ATP-binding protein